MQQNFDVPRGVDFITGGRENMERMSLLPSLEPFNDTVMEFLNELSKELIKTGKAYSDVATFGFWIRRASVLKMKERFCDSLFRLGKGVLFHIAPSNVPVNFAYSLVAGLITGNSNIVRVPSKDFPQVSLISGSVKKVLENFESLKPYITLVKYVRDIEINNFFSSFADVRIVWGGDATIAELRRSPLPPRSSEVTFADRYSLAVIDSDVYLSLENKKKVALDFYNDTYFSDQNACTSPRFVIWMGGAAKEAKDVFWTELYRIVKDRYHMEPVQAVNKLSSFCKAASLHNDMKLSDYRDNLIIRVETPQINGSLADYIDNSGYFYECDCSDITQLIPLCNNKKCQTIGYIGDKKMFAPLLKAGVKGIDRIVPIGKTMDFDLIWDGYNLFQALSRVVDIT